jgi:UDP-glucose 4-epimerase
MAEVLVTGGAGFIGAHVAQHLSSMGHKVTVLDDLSGGFLENVAKEHHFVEGNIVDHELLARLFEEHKFEYVFHLAAYAAEGLSHFIRRFNYTIDSVAKCQTHKIYLDTDRVPEHRKGNKYYTQEEALNV